MNEMSGGIVTRAGDGVSKWRFLRHTVAGGAPFFGVSSAIALLALAACSCAVPRMCLAGPDPLSFEVASVRPSSQLDPLQERVLNSLNENIPLGRFPGYGQTMRFRHISLAQLTGVAYQVRTVAVVGPAWIFEDRFDVIAKMPTGYNRKKDGAEMVRMLLVERFALHAHRDIREMRGYILSVRKGGPNLKEASSVAPTADPNDLMNRPRPRLHGDNLIELGHTDMALLTDVLSRNLQAPVEDQTGLKGFYAVSLRFPGGDSPDGPELAARFGEALSHLGLRLSSGKVRAQIVVVDSASKTPTPN
jgi:uncharacterized protein (TIGR03435 family)